MNASRSPAIAVRPAAPGDLDFIVSSNLALARETEDHVLDETLLSEGVRTLLDQRAPGAYWIAERDGGRVGQLLITFEWSDWRNRMIWWIQSVYVVPDARRDGVFRALYAHLREEARRAGACGIRLYVDTTNTRAQQVYAALGMNGDHYRVFEDMF
jgi:GNAT superfamily N-acetyltransferase